MMMRAMRAEFLKLKRSRMPLWTVLVAVVYAAFAAGMIYVFTNDPSVTKAIASAGGGFTEAAKRGYFELNWVNQLRTAVQGVSGSWGLLTFSFIAAYVFGREYKEGTEKNMLTVPIRREYAVVAKLIVVACWVFGLALFAFVLQAGGIAAMGVKGFAWSHVWKSLGDLFQVTLILYLTLPLVAWVAMAGRGYLKAMVFALVMMGASNGVATTDLSPYFPWNMPVHVIGASWMPIPPAPLEPVSWAIAAAVFGLGVFLAMRQIDTADTTS